MSAYYNEIEPYAAEWLRNLIKAGYIADGEVDTRSIVDVQPLDLRDFTQCHFFAGIGGWSVAARLAGWPDDRPLWTGSCPCQPFSVAGQGKGQTDERHLWPEYFRLIRACRPSVVMGEQVAAAVGKSWLDGVCADLESIDYACGAVVVPACAVNAPHRRDRLWFVADANGGKQGQGRGDDGEVRSISEAQCEPEHGAIVFGRSGRKDGNVADAMRIGRQGQGQMGKSGDSEARGDGKAGDALHAGSGFWSNAGWITGADGKARRVEPSIRLLAHGVSARVGKLRAYGNAIVPQTAAEIIGAYMDVTS
jgi:DNA (cytosine-5)-methyltransferase 1